MIPPVASCNWTVGSVGCGFRPILAANSVERVMRLAPVSKIIGVVSVPFKVTSISKTPPLRRISIALLSTDFSHLASCLTLSSNPRDGPSLGGDFDFDPRSGQGRLDGVVVRQLGILTSRRVDKLAEVEDRLDVGGPPAAKPRCQFPA